MLEITNGEILQPYVVVKWAWGRMQMFQCENVHVH